MNAVDTYIAGFEPEVQQILETIRAMVREEAPETTERMCMGIPTFDMNGKWFVHYAAFPKHIGFYPQPAGMVAFADKLAGYKTSKGSVQFPLNKPIPFDLIREMIRQRAKVSRAENVVTPFEAMLKKLSKPAARAIEGQGITELAQLAKCSDEEMLSWHGLGKAALPVIRAALEAMNAEK